jgi:hypothetical protein
MIPCHIRHNTKLLAKTSQPHKYVGGRKIKIETWLGRGWPLAPSLAVPLSHASPANHSAAYTRLAGLQFCLLRLFNSALLPSVVVHPHPHPHRPSSIRPPVQSNHHLFTYQDDVHRSHRLHHLPICCHGRRPDIADLRRHRQHKLQLQHRK